MKGWDRINNIEEGSEKQEVTKGAQIIHEEKKTTENVPNTEKKTIEEIIEIGGRITEIEDKIEIGDKTGREGTIGETKGEMIKTEETISVMIDKEETPKTEAKESQEEGDMMTKIIDH